MRGDAGGYVIKIQAPPRCGDALLDQEAEARLEMLVDMTGIMADDQTHIMPTHGFLVKRLALKEKQVQTDADSKFEKLGSLKTVPTDWVISLIAQASDMPKELLVKAHAFDEESIVQMLMYGAQVGVQLKLPEELRVKDVLQSVLLARFKECGNRWSSFLEVKAIQKNGKIDWRLGSYDVQFHPNTGKLTGVVHRQTNAKATVEHDLIDKSWALENNFSDYGATFRKAKCPPIKIMSLFSKGEGPLKLAPVTARSKEWAKLVETKYKEWEAAVLATKQGHMSDAAVVVGLKQNTSLKRAATMDALRSKALERAAANKAKLAVSFDSTEGS